MRLITTIISILLVLTFVSEISADNCKKSGSKPPYKLDDLKLADSTKDKIVDLMKKKKKKIDAIKLLRSSCSDLGLKDAKDAVEAIK